MRDILVLQVVLSVTMLIVTFASGNAPLLLLNILQKRGGENQLEKSWFSYLNCFSGGIFLATSFLDIIPENGEHYAELLKEYQLSPLIPLNYLFICIGFFIVYIVEEITEFLFGSGHGHSHGGSKKQAEDSIDRILVDKVPENHGKSNLVKMLTFAIAISFHSFLEGFALGVQQSTASIIPLFFSLLLHKVIEAFSVGLQMSRTRTSKISHIILIIAIYTCMTPIGSICGTILKSTSEKSVWKDGLTVMLESMAGGTFIFITFLEIIAQEKTKPFSSIKQLASIFIGFIIILAVQCFLH